MTGRNQYGLGGVKVMVIDDSKAIRHTAEMLLKNAGCKVVTATDGRVSGDRLLRPSARPRHAPALLPASIRNFKKFRIDHRQTIVLEAI